MAGPGADVDGGAAGAEIDVGQVVAHLPRLIAPGVGALVAEVAGGAIAPALHPAVIQDGAGVVVAFDHLQGGVAGAEIDGGDRGQLAGGVADVLGVALAELALAVVAPAQHLPSGVEGAHVRAVPRCLGAGGGGERGGAESQPAEQWLERCVPVSHGEITPSWL